jgi:rod shape-determining protein MreD
MRRAAGAALMAAAALIQATWAPSFEVGGAFPNLVLVAVVAIAWTSGARPAMVWACIGGVLLDLTASGPIGPHALALLPGVYVIGFWTRNLDHANILQVALTAAVTTALYAVVLVVIAEVLGTPIPPLGSAVQLGFAAAVYNAVLAPLAFELLRALGTISRRAQT